MVVLTQFGPIDTTNLCLRTLATVLILLKNQQNTIKKRDSNGNVTWQCKMFLFSTQSRPTEITAFYPMYAVGRGLFPVR
jgi:hypothetical protein